MANFWVTKTYCGGRIVSPLNSVHTRFWRRSQGIQPNCSNTGLTGDEIYQSAKCEISTPITGKQPRASIKKGPVCVTVNSSSCSFEGFLRRLERVRRVEKIAWTVGQSFSAVIANTERQFQCGQWFWIIWQECFWANCCKSSPNRQQYS